MFDHADGMVQPYDRTHNLLTVDILTTTQPNQIAVSKKTER